MKRHGLLGLLALLLAAPPAFSQASSLANCKFYTKVQQDFEQGFNYCADAIKEFPDDPEARFYGAWCVAEMGELEEAAASFQWLIDRKDDKKVKKFAKMARERVDYYYRDYFNGGQELLKVEDLAGARDSFRMATQIAPRKRDAHLNLGYTLAQLDDLDSALESFSRAVEIDPEDKTAREFYGGALEEKLDALHGEPETDEEAIADISAHLRETLEKILEVDPSSASAHLTLAELDLAADDMESFLEHARKAAEIDASKVADIGNLGIQLFKRGEYARVIPPLELVLEYIPDPEDDMWETCTWLLADSYYEVERFEEALAEYEKLLSRDPDNTDYLGKAGFAARKVGQEEKGVRYLMRREELKEAEIVGE